jgi:N utilization substance protein B
MPHNRRQARILAMQVLCQWDVQKEESPEVLSDFMVSQEASGPAADYAQELVLQLWQQRERVDQCIAAAATKWDVARISPVERNIMRVAVVELLSDEVPAKAAVNEAIEIGREYGGEDSPRFINGVLDVIMKRLDREKRDSADGAV